SSNSVFLDLVQKLGLQLEQFLSSLFSWFSFDRMLFLIAGFYVVGSLLLKTKLNTFSNREARYKDDLQRRKDHIVGRKKQPLYNFTAEIMGKFANGTMALKNENVVGIISLALLNALLLLVNVIDVIYIWFNFSFANSNLY